MIECAVFSQAFRKNRYYTIGIFSVAMAKRNNFVEKKHSRSMLQVHVMLRVINDGLIAGLISQKELHENCRRKNVENCSKLAKKHLRKIRYFVQDKNTLNNNKVLPDEMKSSFQPFKDVDNLYSTNTSYIVEGVVGEDIQNDGQLCTGEIAQNCNSEKSRGRN